MKKIGYVAMVAFVVGVFVAADRLMNRGTGLGEVLLPGLALFAGLLVLFCVLIGSGKFLGRLTHRESTRHDHAERD